MSTPTDKHSAEDLTRQDLEAIFDGRLEGIVAFDDRQQVIGLNRAACDILQIDKRQAAGLPCRQLFGESVEKTAPAENGPSPPLAAADPREVLQRELEATGWNVAQTARRMQLSRTAIYQRIARFGLKRPQE